MITPDFVSYYFTMGNDPKFDYGDPVKVTGGEHTNRFGDVVGINITASPRTYTVEFGDGSDAEVEEGHLSKINE